LTTPVDLVVAAEDAGDRLDSYLGGRSEIGSRAAAQRLIDAGAVRVDGELRAKRHRLTGGERVVVEGRAPTARSEGWTRSAHPHEPVDGSELAGLGISYEDDELIVVDKPAGIVVHPAPGNQTGTLAQFLAARGGAGGDDFRPGIVHRLDKDTSGLMVVAKSEAVLRALQQSLRRRELRRTYLALVAGRPESATGTIDAAIGRDPAERTRQAVEGDGARAARTHFEIAELLPRTTLLHVRLETGRTHQIRVHLAAIGLPVCGDRRYGGEACGARLGLTRQFLHSSKLVFRHPSTGEQVVCESKPPADLRRTYDAAKREPVSGGPDGD